MAEVELNGVSYELPERFSMGEMRIVERYAGGHLTSGGYEVAAMAGAIHIAIKRVKSELSFEEIQEVVDEIDMESLEEALKDSGGQSPPAESSSELSESSNGASDPSSDASPENETRQDSGSPDSATGFRSFHGISTS